MAIVQRAIKCSILSAGGLWALFDAILGSYRRIVSNYGLEVLSEDECGALLRTQRVGRIAVCGAKTHLWPTSVQKTSGLR